LKLKKEPKSGTLEADRFDLLATMIADDEIKHWPINKTPLGSAC
jgi:antitoxin component HigA of HigAB toxin-antitoxin module